MTITKFETKDKGKVKIYINGEYHFILYTKDIRTYHLQEGAEISEDVYRDIVVNTVQRRAKQKAMAILKYTDRTEYELKLKLKQADYTEEIISAAIDYVKAFHYLDDERFARNYVEYKKLSKSKRQIQMELMNKGVSKEYIELALEEEYTGEEDAIRKAIAKKTKNRDDLSKEEIMKVANYLYNKGFSMELIKKHLDF